MDFLQLKKVDVHLKRSVPLYQCYKHTTFTLSKNTDGEKEKSGTFLFLTLTLWTTHMVPYTVIVTPFYSQEVSFHFHLYITILNNTERKIKHMKLHL